MSAFPPDDVLLARGKYSTLGRERREQIERVQKICTTLMSTTNHILKDCQERPPANIGLIERFDTSRTNLLSARERIVELCLEMAELKPLAWDNQDEQ